MQLSQVQKYKHFIFQQNITVQLSVLSCQQAQKCFYQIQQVLIMDYIYDGKNKIKWFSFCEKNIDFKVIIAYYLIFRQNFNEQDEINDKVITFQENYPSQIQIANQRVQKVQKYNMICLGRQSKVQGKSNDKMKQNKVSKPSMTQNFHKIAQAGDFVLSQNFSESYSIFGFTKAGKTSAGHMLCNSPLIGVGTFQGLVYEADQNSNFFNAKIGGQSWSQTKIPNIFRATQTNQKGASQNLFVFDQPGFNDSAGFHDLLANGYFHYKTFSKVSKLKFLIAIEKADLTGIAENFRKVIFLFTNFFKNYSQIKTQILKATAILITKIQPGVSVDVVKQFITKIKTNMKGMSAADAKIFNQFVEDMVNNNKIALIPRPKQVGSKNEKNTILKDLDKKTSFWIRQTINGKVDMSNINFSVTSEVIDNLTVSNGSQAFDSNFNSYLDEMKFKHSKFLRTNSFSVAKIVKLLEKDAMASSDSCEYLSSMDKLYRQNYGYFDQKFNNKREDLESLLLTNPQFENDLQNPQKKKRLMNAMKIDQITEAQKRQMYFIKKFQLLEYIQQKSKLFMDEKDDVFAQRTPNSLEEIKNFLIRIFQKIYYSQLDQLSWKAISKSYYLIQRLVEETKIIVLVLLGDGEIRERLLELKQNRIVQALINTQMKTLINSWAGIQIQKMKLQYIQKLNLDKLTFPINMEVINFFESFKGLDVNLKLKLVYIVVKYYENNANSTPKKLSLIGQKILNYRIYFEDFMASPDKKLQDEIQSAIFITSKILASILIKLNQILLAIEIYENVNSPEGIFSIFREKIKKAANSSVLVKQLREYARYAASYSRIDLAIQCYQEAFHSQNNAVARREIGIRIHELSTQGFSNEGQEYMKKAKICSSISEAKNKESQNYVTRLYSQLLAEKFPKKLIAQIQQVFKQNSI